MVSPCWPRGLPGVFAFADDLRFPLQAGPEWIKFTA
jgi:hypothetical protein